MAVLTNNVGGIVMKEYKVPVQSLIDHIKTAIDVDPWAKEMAEDLLKEQEAVEPEVDVLNEIDRLYRCPKCHKHFFYRKQKYCDQCGQEIKWNA